MKYRREIDGLRAVAVMPVILFHAGFSVFGGGYVGVDVFFVISGYLITSILIGELEQGNFSIARFYERRARRILPALFVVMLACLPFAYAWMLPSQLKDFGQSLVAVVFFASNVLFVLEEGYFATAAELKPLLHTWSLAVEEQYYLLFPVFLFLFWRFGRTAVFWSIAVIAVLSLLLAEWGWRNYPSAAFYLAPTRAWELLAGSICAFLIVGRETKSSNPLSALGLALIVFAIFMFDENTPFPSFHTLAPVLGSVLIILFAAQGTWVARLLSLRGFVGIGLISYSAYLWHQPLFAFARLPSLTEPSHSLMAGLAVVALLLAWATWYFVEQPFRKRANPLLATRGRVFLASGLVGAVFVAIGVAGHVGKGFEWRGKGDVSFARLETRLEPNRGLHEDCEYTFNSSENCRTAERANVLLWGDSYAMHLVQGILASEENLALQQQTKSSCSPVLGIAQFGATRSKAWARECHEFNSNVLNWLQSQDVALVILSSPFRDIFRGDLLLRDGEVVHVNKMQAVTEGLINTAEAIRQAGARVVIVSPTPRSGWNSGQCLMRSVFFDKDDAGCDFPLDISPPPFELLRAVEPEVAVHWLSDDICKNGECDAMQDGFFIYRDTGHLSREGSAYLGRAGNWMETFRRIAN